MDTNAVYVATEGVNAGELEAHSSTVHPLEGISSSGDIMQELEVVTRVELDVACSSEKLVNLNILMMHVATRESDFEGFVSEREHISSDSAEKALEFDLLSGILDSEVSELTDFISTLQMEIINGHETISSLEHLGNVFEEMEEKLHDSEESLKQSLDQVSEIRMQSAKFQRILFSYGGHENWNDDNGVDFVENGENLNAKIRMQTAEQQRHVLRMLEKSLARELDLEKKVADSRQIEDELKLRLNSSEHEVFCMDEETSVILERLFEADNAAEVLMGISKEILGQLQIVQLNLNSSLQREGELSSKLQDSMEKQKAEDSALQKLESSLSEARNKLIVSNSAVSTLREKVSSLEEQLKESEKVDLLEKQLRESDIQIQHAVASAEASQEKQSMLYSTIVDMENVIADLKSKVLKAENRAENAEEKCIILSESNSDLSEELSFLRVRMKCLEASMHQAEDKKVAMAKDINIRTKVITDLVMKLALERERLHKQISLLTKQNKILLENLLHKNKNSSVTLSHDGKGIGKGILLSKHDITTTTCKESKESTKFSATSFETRSQNKFLLVRLNWGLLVLHPNLRLRGI
ncbi:WPP domain-interacting tail-anchored protein 1 isoform X2 [Cornus florida]|uniref:WPP domain-interacting tail-anchored protein 1 isoform X2 n=1 Tax=Cornus florida TaxID=4283 RepID=UPI002897CE16|nr:WPP domain-interacting tail-anchored protein 1 isoform X2 [Cornus florida]